MVTYETVICPFVGNNVLLKTADTYNYRQTWLDVQRTTQFQFKVRACQDAVIELRPNQNQLTEYKIKLVLGSLNNMYTTIYYKKPDTAELKNDIPTPNILNCDIYKRFWIRWQHGFLSLGRKQFMTNLVFSEPDPYRNIRPKALSVGSLQPQNFAEWEFDKYACKTMYLIVISLKNII